MSAPRLVRTRALARARCSALVTLASLGTLVSACGGGFHVSIRNPNDTLGGSDRSDRIALGAIDADLATDAVAEIARLRRITAIELNVGNLGLAEQATLRALRIARAHAALAPAEHRGDAESLRREMQHDALSVAERVGSLELALEAVGRTEPEGAREVIARLVRLRADAGGSLAGVRLAEPLVRSLDDEARLDFERLGAEVPGAALSPERLQQLGLRALPRLHQLLALAARRQDSAQLAAIAHAIRELDRWDPVARAIGHLEQAHALDLAIDVVGTAPASARGVAIARLERARRADAASAATAIALAAHCLGAHLEGDALDQARAALNLSPSDEERRTAELIAALAQTVDGDGGAFAEWERGHDDASRSVAVARALAPLRSIAGASEPLRARARAASRLLVSSGVGDTTLTFEVVSDPSTPGELREHALDALWLADRPAARIAAQCVSGHVARADCDARLTMLGENVWWEGLVPTGTVPDLDETALPPFELAVSDANVSAVSSWVASADARRLALAPAWIRARIVLAARSGDLSGARAVLDAEGRLLTAASRVVLESWLADLSASRDVSLDDLSIALGLGTAVQRFTTAPLDEAFLEVPDPTTETERFVSADSHLAYDTWRADAPAHLLPLLEGAGDRDGAVVAGWIATAIDRDLRERGVSTATLGPIAERAHALAPESTIDRLIEALRIADTEGPAPARDAFARALELAPEARAIQRRWLAAWNEADPFAPADEARAQLLAIDPFGVPPGVASGQGSSIAELLALYGVELPARHPDAVLHAGPAAARAEGAWDAIMALIRQRMTAGTTASGGTDALRALVEAAPPSPARRRWRVALRILVSDLAGANDAADEPESDEVVPGTDPPLPPDDRLRALVRGRRELPDALLWALVAEEVLGDDPATLEQLRTRALHRPLLDPLLCGELVRDRGFAPSTMEVCLRAWRHEPEPVSATAIARAFVEGRSAVWARELTPSAFLDQARSALGEQLPAAVLHREAIVRERMGERDRALDAEIEAEARGWVPAAWDADGPAMRRGIVVRAQRARPAAPRWSELALLALGDARLVAAQLYADAAVASVRGRTEDDTGADLAYAARDLVAWAGSDLASDHIDADGIAAFERARVRGMPSTDTASLASHYPDSALAAYAATVSAIRSGDETGALQHAEVGLRGEPRPTLVSAIAPVVQEVRGRGEADALRARAHSAYPDDPRIDRVAVEPVPVVAATASADASGCALTSQLASAADDSARAALLRDAFRAASDEAARRRVLVCAGAASALSTPPPSAPPATPTSEPTTVAMAEAPAPEHHAPTSASERRRISEQAAADAQRADEESRRRAAEAEQRAAEGERRAAEAEALRREAEARLAEAERRAAEAERRALAAQARTSAAEPTAVATSDAERRAAEAERRVAEAERRAAEADARAALAERTAIEEMRRMAEASRRIEAATATAAATTASTPPPLATTPEPTTTLADPDAGVPSEAQLVAAPVVAAPVVADPVVTAVAPTAAPADDAGVTSPEPTTPVSASASTTASAPADAPQAAAAAESNILYSPEMPPPTPAEVAARARAIAAAADQRVAESDARVATAAARAADAEAVAAEAGPRAAHAETLVVAGEQRALEAETRAAEAERRAAEASHRLEEVVRGPELAAPAAVASVESPAPTPTPSPAPASPPPSHLGGLGVDAVLDDDPAAQQRGLELVEQDPEGALAAAREVVLALPSAAAPESDGLPRFGKVQALVGLPSAARRRLAAELMNGSDRDLRLMALAAEQVQPGTVDVDALRRTIESDDADLAIEAVRAHGGRAELVELAAMRTRLDAMHAPLSTADRALARELVHALAAAIDPHDRARIAAAPALARDGLGEDAMAADLALARAIDHDAALYAAARAPGAPRDPTLAPEAERIRRARRPSPPSAEAVRLLGSEPLARVLTGTSWRYVRLPEPAHFVAAMTGGTTDPALARATSAWLDDHGGTDLGPDAGLDGDRPIECALADSGPSSWVCVAHVRDRDRLRASLARRPLGAHSAPWLALAAADLARALPMMAGATPFAIDRIAAEPLPSAAGELAFTERARAEVDLGGVTLERYATIERRADAPTLVDGELYLFTGDRVVVFGDEDIARTLVGAPPSAARALARAARFRRVTRGWTDGTTLEIATLDWRPAAEMPLVARRDASIVLAPDAGGVVVTVDAPFAERIRDVSPLSALLPDDAVARFALAVHAPPAARARGRAPAAAPPADRAAVARLVLRESERIAFAWTPGASEALWDHWIAVGEGPRLDAALRAAGVTPPAAGTMATLAGTTIARLGTRWIIAPVEEDVVAALARTEAAPVARTTAMGSGRLDAARGARFVTEMARPLPAADPHRAALDTLGARLAAAGELTFEATVERRALVLVTRVRPRVP